MFQILSDPKFDFMKRGQLLLGLSGMMVLLSVAVLLTKDLNLGIEFTGGTELQIKYAEAPDLGQIRSVLRGAGLTAQVTTIGAAEEHEVYIRLTDESEQDDRGKLVGTVARTLRGDGEAGKTDLNIADQITLRDLLLTAPDMVPSAADRLSKAITSHRTDVAIFHSIDDAEAVPGLSAELHVFLAEHCFTGPLAVRSQSYVGPSIGQELMSKARLAIVLSLVMMLLYIWLRFQLRWGVAAVIALTHDTLITLALFALFGKELSLPVVAAFLTLVGYSVNDTVVVFDRIRENLRNRSGSGLVETINLSLNQTLGRTVVTSGLTWIVVFGLYLYGGPALNAFAFVLTVGIIVGTYSSIFVASPVLVLWDRWQGEKKGTEHSGASPVRRVKKVRTS